MPNFSHSDATPTAAFKASELLSYTNTRGEKKKIMEIKHFHSHSNANVNSMTIS